MCNFNLEPQILGGWVGGWLIKLAWATCQIVFVTFREYARMHVLLLSVSPSLIFTSLLVVEFGFLLFLFVCLQHGTVGYKLFKHFVFFCCHFLPFVISCNLGWLMALLIKVDFVRLYLRNNLMPRFVLIRLCTPSLSYYEVYKFCLKSFLVNLFWVFLQIFNKITEKYKHIQLSLLEVLSSRRSQQFILTYHIHKRRLSSPWYTQDDRLFLETEGRTKFSFGPFIHASFWFWLVKCSTCEPQIFWSNGSARARVISV